MSSLSPSPANPDRRIFLVDDSKTALFFGRMQLSKGGYQVETSSSSNLAQTIEKFAPDLVLMDVYMSGVEDNGAQITKALRKIPFSKAPKIILYSSLPKSTLERLQEESGADGIIEKTNDAEELLAKVAALFP